MSRFHDDTTAASNAGAFLLSDRKLRRLCPNLFGVGSLLPSSRMWRDRIAEHLRVGDARAAMVVQTAPLRVAAFTDELDCAVLLSFPDELAHEHRLQVGDRMLTVNTYGSDAAMAGDLIPGPAALGRWTNFYPLIADFLSDQAASLNQHKASISEQEWRRLATCAQELVLHESTPRSGDPTLSWQPAGAEMPAASARVSLSPFARSNYLGLAKLGFLVLIGPPALLLTGHVVLGIITMALLVGTGAALWLVRAGRLRSLTEIRIPTWLGYTFAAAFTFALCAAIIFLTRTP